MFFNVSSLNHKKESEKKINVILFLMAETKLYKGVDLHGYVFEGGIGVPF